ncbi:MAG: ATP-binding protein, partial [Sphingomonadales bacterium]|nr:ATP-binding protein [Sphingomonadales bacterium]
ESQLLVQKVVDQIDVAIIAWDQNGNIRLINPAASRLLSEKPVANTGAEASLKLPEELAFANDMQVGETLVADLTFRSEPARYRLHLERFISEGDTHNLLFLTNVSSILRLEERRAWRNLVRVLSHEINNSLAPLKSFSDSLKTQIEKRESDESLKQELLDGMSVIGNRADSLASFVQSYHKIAKLPEPEKREQDFRQLMEGLVKFFPENPIVLQGEPVKLRLDAGQMEQALINLIKNAVEASSQGESIEVSWRQEGRRLVVVVRDHGEGIQNPENLFTPYYTTKPSGSGIGLVFCQQVIEAHDGYLTIANRDDGPGCEASITLPLA